MDVVEIIARAICGEPPDSVGRITCDDGRVVPRGELAWTAWREDAELVVKDLSAAGFVIVPKEPTHEMIVAGNEAYNAGRLASGIYRAMISAHDQAKG